MPDCPNCTSPPSPSPAIDPAALAALAEAQRNLARLTAELAELDHRLAELAAELPPPASEFNALAELAGTIACVRSDLLADVLSTLDGVSRRDEDELHREFDKRRRRTRRPRSLAVPLPALLRRRPAFTLAATC